MYNDTKKYLYENKKKIVIGLKVLKQINWITCSPVGLSTPTEVLYLMANKIKLLF